MLLAAIVFLGAFIGIWNEWIYGKYAKDVYQLAENEIAVQSDLKITENLKAELAEWVNDHWGVDGIAISRIFTTSNQAPLLYTYTKDEETERHLKSIIQPQYNQEGSFTPLSSNSTFLMPVLVSKYSGYTNTTEYDPDKHYFTVHVAMKYFNYTLFYTLGYCLLAGYWLTFALWASMNAYYDRRGNVLWVALFMTLNIVGYLIYKLAAKRKI